MNKSNALFLHHIQNAISRIEEYTENTDWKSFYENFLVQDGVIRQLEIIGEAVKNLSNELREKMLIFHGKISQECVTNLSTTILESI